MEEAYRARTDGAEAGSAAFDTSAYIGEWADGDAELVKSTAARVLCAVHRIA